MKKVFCMILIGVAGLSFVACGGNEKEQVIEDKKPVVQETIEEKAHESVENVEGEKPVEDIEKEDVEESEKETEKEEKEEEVKPESEKPEGEEETKPEVEKPKPEVEKPKPEVEKPEVEKPKPEVEKPEVDNEDKVERTFKIKTKDDNSNIVSGGEIKTVGLGVAENIQKILGTVSSKYFGGQSLSLSRIENVGGKKIAVVNLGGDEAAWYNRLQGSAYAVATSYTLVENVLQRDYNGYWIDGVKFTINGGAIQDSGHAGDLVVTSYR